MRHDIAYAPDTDQTDGTRVCPECGEPARHLPPTARFPWAAHHLPVPQWSHTDGEPLCPVPSDTGRQPAEPA